MPDTAAKSSTSSTARRGIRHRLCSYAFLAWFCLSFFAFGNFGSGLILRMSVTASENFSGWRDSFFGFKIHLPLTHPAVVLSGYPGEVSMANSQNSGASGDPLMYTGSIQEGKMEIPDMLSI